MVEESSIFIAGHVNADDYGRVSRGKVIKSSSVNDLTALDDDDDTPIIYPKEEHETVFIRECLSDNFIFDELSDDDTLKLIESFVKKEFIHGEAIITEGDIGDYFYIVYDGTVSITVGEEARGTAERGKSFGELALIYDSPRSATCVAETNVTTWAVDQKTFKDLLRKSSDKETSGIIEILRKVPFLSELDMYDMGKIADALIEKDYAENETIFSKGDIGENFYIVKSGTVKVHDIGAGGSQYVDQKMTAGSYFGEKALMTGEPRGASVTAVTAVTTLYLSREDFQKTCGNLQQLIDDAHKKRSMLAVPIFASSKLGPEDFRKLMDMFQTMKYTKGEFLNIEGRPIRNQGFYIIDKGEVRIIDNEANITTLTKGDHFGGRGIKIKLGTPSERTIEMMEDTTCQVLSLKAIESVVGSVERLGKPQSFEKKLADITFKDLYIHKVLGAGSFGIVTLVSNRNTGAFYAMKQLSKDKLLATGQIRSVFREKNIMASVHHPLILNLHAAFQDNNSLYMIIDLAEGGELYGVIKSNLKYAGVGREAALFYSAGVIESLHHIHSRYIAYRDLKPENILVDKDGYCILIDFGFAKVVMDKTYSMLGTPEYLAPEVLLSKGYNYSVDYWGFGCLIYELLSGGTPFMKNGITELELFRRIAKGKYSFPTKKNDFDDLSRDIIHKLLVKKTSRRLGCMANKTVDIKNHDYFKSIDWGALCQKKLKSPWVPSVSNTDKDKSSRCRITSSGKNLNAKEQKEFEDFGPMHDLSEAGPSGSGGGSSGKSASQSNCCTII